MTFVEMEKIRQAILIIEAWKTMKKQKFYARSYMKNLRLIVITVFSFQIIQAMKKQMQK